MRRTALTLSAFALISTLGACSGSNDTTSGDSNNESSGGAFQNVASLVSNASQSMTSKKTVTFDFKTAGGAAQGPMAAMSNMSCEIDMAKSLMSCDGPMSMVITEQAAYMKMPGSGGSGKPWVKTEMASDAMKQGFSSMSMKKFSDIEAMLPNGSKITNTSQETVAGERTTRYEVTTDVAKAATEAKGMAKSGMRVLQKQGIKEVERTVWVGPDGLPAKVESTTPAMEVMGQKIPKSTITVTYSDWGKPVDITVPPESKIRDMPAIPSMPNMPN